MSTEVTCPKYPSEVPLASDFQVKVNDVPTPVLDTEIGAFANIETTGVVHFEISTTIPFKAVKVRPLSRGVSATVAGQTIRFSVSGPAKLSVELDDQIRRPLFLFVDAPETETPQGDVIRFQGGKVHEPGAIHLKDDQTLYIEAGAVVHGAIYAENAKNIRIMGRGVLDGRPFKKHEHNMVRPVRCSNVLIEGITIVGSPSWTVCPYGCDDVVIRNVKLVNWRDNDDGIDVVGCQRVLIDDCFVRTKDDCIAIKATGYHHEGAGLRDVKDVTIQKSVFWNAQWGNALEIGFETRCESISNVTFRDCDVIRCEREGYYSGGVFTIHNGDRAVVSNIRYENIRVEDAREKLMDFKVLHSHYSKDTARGQIRDVYLKDIQVIGDDLPPSIIQSFDRDHRVENVTIENLTHKGQKITSLLQAHAITERTVNVKVI